jgi:putative membrane protein
VSVTFLPTLNALLNLTSAILLFSGRMMIKRGRQDTHKTLMLSALASSALFLTSYLIYHAIVGSVPYAHHDWTRTLYFAILIPHSFFAAIMVPFIIAAVWLALRRKFDQHRRIVRWLWPVWMLVSLSGIVVYVMLYHV